MKRNIWKSLLFGVVCVLGIFGWIGVIASVKVFITPWWRIPCVALVTALLLAGPLCGLWCRISDMKKGFLARLLAVAVFSGVLSGAGLIVNFSFDREGTTVATERHAVSGLFRTEHQNRRRVGRHYVATGSVSYRYHAEVEVSGRTVEVPLSFQRYRRLRAGRDSISVDIHHGILGGDFVTVSK